MIGKQKTLLGITTIAFTSFLLIGQNNLEAPIEVQEETPGLIAKAAVSPDSALALAFRAVPNGQIIEAEIEDEGDGLVYSFDIQSPNHEGLFEVLVDALTGVVGEPEPEGEDDLESEDDSDPDEEDDDFD